MSASLEVGLCTKITFSKIDTDSIKKYYPNISDFQMDFEKETYFALSYCNFSEFEGKSIFSVKHELLEPNDLILFLQDFFSFKYNNQANYLKRYDKLFKRLEQFNTASELIACIENEDNFDINSYNSMSSVHLSSGLYLSFEFDYIQLDTYHKAYIELEGLLCSYLTRLVQFRHSQPQAKLIKFFIDG